MQLTLVTLRYSTCSLHSAESDSVNASMVEVEIFLGFFEQVEIVIPALSGLPGCLKVRNFNETISFQDAHRARK